MRNSSPTLAFAFLCWVSFAGFGLSTASAAVSGLADPPRDYIGDATDFRVDAQVVAMKQLLTHFHFVSAGPNAGSDPRLTGLYRGAIPIADHYSGEPEFLPELQPRIERGLHALRDQLGVRTVLDLETSGLLLNAERSAAARVGIRLVNQELPPFVAKPTRQRMTEIIELLDDPAAYPLYVHCRYGQDRTGLVVGLYRYFIGGMAAEEAYAEMKDLGFHSIEESSIEIGLDCFFRQATGMSVPGACAWIPAYNPH